MKLLMTDEFVPRGKVQYVDGNIIVLADVKYLGEVKDPSAAARIQREINEKVARRKSFLNMGEFGKYMRRMLLARINELRLELESLPRVEVWRREYRVLARRVSELEARYWKGEKR